MRQWETEAVKLGDKGEKLMRNNVKFHCTAGAIMHLPEAQLVQKYL